MLRSRKESRKAVQFDFLPDGVIPGVAVFQAKREPALGGVEGDLPLNRLAREPNHRYRAQEKQTGEVGLWQSRRLSLSNPIAQCDLNKVRFEGRGWVFRKQWLSLIRLN